MILHIDANSFYASCERLFRPDLDNKPIAVLSNNDGMTIALNQECKNLGFSRGDVFAKEKYRYQRNNVFVFSSNYTLYADISKRINMIYEYYCPEVEFYSIDESFLNFPDWKNLDFVDLAFEIKNCIWQSVHIPVSVGIAPTKTLAKFCNSLAKKRNGVCSWFSINQEEELKNFKAYDIWGIGRAKSALLERKGIFSAYDLKNYPLHLVKKYLTITGFNTVRELNEIPSLKFETSITRKNITTSRSFSKKIETLVELETALSEFTQLAVSRMRENNLACKFISVCILTGKSYNENEKSYYNVAHASLEKHTSFLPEILGTAIKLLHSIFLQGYKYKKVMITLLDLTEDKHIQGELFKETSIEILNKKKSIMKVYDSVNEKYGKGTLHTGIRNQIADFNSQGNHADWIMNRNFLSPEYTTNFNELPIVL